MRFSSRKRTVLLAATGAVFSGLWHPAQANSYTWTSTTDQSWLNNVNWGSSVVPGSGEIGMFVAAFAPPSKTVIINSDTSVGAVVDNLAGTSSLTINGPGSGSATLTVFGQTATVPQPGGSFTSSNVILSATSNASNATRNLTLGSSLNLKLANTQNMILGTQGATSGGSGQGNVITIGGVISDGAGGPASITYLGNGNFQNEGGALALTGVNTFSGGLTIGSADGLNGGQVRVTASGNLGTGPITVNDQGQLSFNASGAYGSTGQMMTVNGSGMLNNTGSSGAFRTGASSIVWQGDLSIGASLPADGTNGYVVLSATNGNTFDIRGKVTGSGNLQKQGGGTLLFSGASNDGTGATQIGNGNLTVANGSSMATGDLIMLQSSSNTGVALNLFNSAQNVGNLSSGFTQTSGTFVQFVNLGTLGGGVGGILNIKQTSAKSFGYGQAIGLTSTIQGPGAISLDLLSTATLTLTGPNSYQGGTTINGGTLNLANPSGSATGTGGVVINSGGHLATGNTTVLGNAVTSGTISGKLTVNSGGQVYPGGSGAVGTLSVGSMETHSGSALKFDLIGGRSASADKIIASSAMTLDAAGTETIDVTGSQLAFGTYQLISYASLTGGSGSFTLGTTPGGANRTYALNTDPTGVNLVVTNTGTERDWSLGGGSPPADGSGTWTIGSTNFFNTPGTPSAPYDNSSNVDLVVGNSGAGGTITLGSDVRVGGALILGDVTTPYTIGAGGGTHTLQLAKGIASSANATINAPVILEATQTFTVDANHTVTVNGSISQTGGAATLTKDDVGTLSLTGTGTYTGGTVVNNGTLQTTTSAVPAAGGITNNANLRFTQTVSGTYAGDISGAGTVTIANTSGTVATTLSGNNVYTGPTVLQSGALAISSPSGIGTGTIFMNGGTLRTDADVSLPGTNKRMTLVVGSTSSINSNGHTLTLNNLFDGGGNLTKTGAGTLVIAGIHTTDVLGELAISAGTVSINSPSTVSYGFAAANAGNTFQGDLVIANPIELRLQGGTISGGGTIRVKPSTVQIVSRGATTIGNNIILNDNAVPISGFSADLAANVSNTLTITGAISGQADVNFSGGAGIVFLSGANTYTGATDIDNGLGGEVVLLADNTLPVGTDVHVSSTGVFDLAGHNQRIASLAAGSQSATVLNGYPTNGQPSVLSILGAGSTHFDGFVQDGQNGTLGLTLATGNIGTLELTGTNSYSGATTLNGGTLIVSQDVNLGATSGTAGPGGGTIAFGGGALAVTASFDTTDRPLRVNAGASTIALGNTVALGLLGSAPTAWAGGTLNVAGAGTTAIARSGGTVTVTPGSTLGLSPLSTVTVGGTVDPFTDSADSTRHVAIVSDGTFSVTSGNAAVASHIGSGTIIVASGSSLKLDAASSSVVNRAGALTLPTGSKLDLTKSSMIVDYTGTSPLGAIETAIKTAYTGGTWTGTGITSSNAAAVFANPANLHKTGIGYAEATELFSSFPASFQGQSIDNTAVITRYTYYGDANLDSSVDTVDFNLLVANFSQAGTDWNHADFNYNNTTDTIDFNLLAANFGQVLPAAPPASAAPAAGPGALAPEPTGALLLLAPAVLARRLRRAKKMCRIAVRSDRAARR